jgi:hypothetical protein
LNRKVDRSQTWHKTRETETEAYILWEQTHLNGGEINMRFSVYASLFFNFSAKVRVYELPGGMNYAMRYMCCG